VLALLAVQPAPAADRAVTIRVGNLANKGERARFERRVWEGCGREARITIERHASSKRAGRVIGQYPPRGTRIGCHQAAATLQVSAGPAQARLFVPALIEPAQRRAFARELRKACGAPVAITETRSRSFLPPGRYIEQSPAQGVRYRCGTPIEIRLSAGPRGEALAARRGPAEALAARRGPGEALAATKGPREALAARAAPLAATAAQPAPREAPAPAREQSPAPAAGPPAAAQPAGQQPDQRTGPNPLPAPAVAVETLAPADIPAAPGSTPLVRLLAPSLLLLLLAALLVPVMLRRLAPRPRPHAPAAAANPTAPPLPPVAPILALERGWPHATARLLPPARVPTGPPVDALPPVPLLRDFLRPLDPALDWIAGTPLSGLGSPGVEATDGAETLVSLRADFHEALRFALLFELPPLLARAWASSPDLPLAAPGARRGWCILDPHTVEVAVTPDLTLTAAGLPVARPALRLRLQFTFPAARLFLRGAALDAFEPGPVHASATLDWAGQSRPLGLLRAHASWPGQLSATPPLQLHAAPRQARAVG
jgi:hypothetical protein